MLMIMLFIFFFFFQAEDGIRDSSVTGVQTCALPILDPVRANIASLQNTLHMAAADLPNNAALHGAHHNLVERRRDPSLSFLHFTRQRDQLQSRFLCDARWATTALPLPDPLPTLPCDALAPQAHRLHGHAQFLRNHRIRLALLTQSRDARTHHIPLWVR